MSIALLTSHCLCRAADPWMIDGTIDEANIGDVTCRLHLHRQRCLAATAPLRAVTYTATVTTTTTMTDGLLGGNVTGGLDMAPASAHTSLLALPLLATTARTKRKASCSTTASHHFCPHITTTRAVNTHDTQCNSMATVTILTSYLGFTADRKRGRSVLAGFEHRAL